MLKICIALWEKSLDHVNKLQHCTYSLESYAQGQNHVDFHHWLYNLQGSIVAAFTPCSTALHNWRMFYYKHNQDNAVHLNIIQGSIVAAIIPCSTALHNWHMYYYKHNQENAVQGYKHNQENAVQKCTYKHYTGVYSSSNYPLFYRST